jgi:hypothetical protein
MTRDELDKYVRSYNEAKEHFLNVEREQIEQIRRILTCLTVDQQKIIASRQQTLPRLFLLFDTSFVIDQQDDCLHLQQTMSNSSMSLQLTSPVPMNKSCENDWNDLLVKVKFIHDIMLRSIVTNFFFF